MTKGVSWAARSGGGLATDAVAFDEQLQVRQVSPQDAHSRHAIAFAAEVAAEARDHAHGVGAVGSVGFVNPHHVQRQRPAAGIVRRRTQGDAGGSQLDGGASFRFSAFARHVDLVTLAHPRCGHALADIAVFAFYTAIPATSDDAVFAARDALAEHLVHIAGPVEHVHQLRPAGEAIPQRRRLPDAENPLEALLLFDRAPLTTCALAELPRRPCPSPSSPSGAGT